MIVTVTGIVQKQYKDKTTGMVNIYTKCHAIHKFGKIDNENGNKSKGQQVIEFYVDNGDFDFIDVDKKMSLDFDQKGRLIDYELLDD